MSFEVIGWLDSPGGHMFSILKNKNVRLLWISRALSRFGDAFESLALMYLVYDLTGSSLAMGSIMIFSMVPNILISPLAGVVCDRYNKKVVMFVSEMVRAVSILTIPLLMYLNIIELWHLYLIAVLVSIGESFFEPCVGAVFLEIVDEDQYADLNSLTTTTNKVMRLLGYSLAGFFIAFVGKEFIFMIDSLTFFISAFAATLYTIEIRSVQNTLTVRRFVTEFNEGLTYIFSKMIMLYMFLSILIINAISTPLGQFLPILIRDVLGLTDVWSGILMTASTISSLLGGIAFPFIVKRGYKLNLFYLLTMVSFSLVISLALLFNGIAVGLLLFIVSGFMGSIIGMWSFTKIQQAIDDKKYAGRVSSVASMILMASVPLSAALSGFLIDTIGIRLTYAIVVLISILAGVFLYFTIGKVDNNQEEALKVS